MPDYFAYMLHTVQHASEIEPANNNPSPVLLEFIHVHPHTIRKYPIQYVREICFLCMYIHMYVSKCIIIICMNTHCVHTVHWVGAIQYTYIRTYVYTYLCAGRNSSTCTRNGTIRLWLLRDPAYVRDECVASCSLVWLPSNNQ